MKKILRFIVFTICITGYSQVGVRTPLTDASTQLDVVAVNKGILMPRLSLISTTDISTITSGNKESQLLYSKTTVSDITPGYCYWDVNKWKH